MPTRVLGRFPHNLPLVFLRIGIKPIPENPNDLPPGNVVLEECIGQKWRFLVVHNKRKYAVLLGPRFKTGSRKANVRSVLGNIAGMPNDEPKIHPLPGTRITI